MKIMVKRTFHQPVLILIALFRVLYVPALHTVVAVAGTFNWFRRQLLHLSYAVCFSLVADANWLGLGSLDIFPKTECKADVMTTNNRNSLSRNVIHRIFSLSLITIAKEMRMKCKMYANFSSLLM